MGKITYQCSSFWSCRFAMSAHKTNKQSWTNWQKQKAIKHQQSFASWPILFFILERDIQNLNYNDCQPLGPMCLRVAKLMLDIRSEYHIWSSGFNFCYATWMFNCCKKSFADQHQNSVKWACANIWYFEMYENIETDEDLTLTSWWKRRSTHDMQDFSSWDGL